MAERADKAAWMLMLLAAALGVGAFGRFPLGRGADGLVFAAALALGVVLLAVPLLLGEAALGQFRRRNVVDALGPTPWRFAGWAFAAASLVLAGYLALVAGWAARYAIASFQGSYFDDPARYFRLASQGLDAMLLALLAVAAAVAVHFGGPRTVRGALAATAVVGALAIAALAAWGLMEGGAGGRDAAFAFALGDIDGAVVAAGFQQALVPALVGVGAVATLSSRVQDRTLPAEATTLAILWVAIAVAASAGLAALAVSEGVTLDGGLRGAFTSIPALFAAVGDTAGGVMSGLFFGVLLAGSLAAMVLLFEVPMAVLRERSQDWTTAKGALASGFAAYLLALPLAFVGGLAWDVELAMRAILAPLAGLALALHVGWLRPEVLSGFTVGDAGHRLDATLRPALRYAVPVLLVALFVVGTMGALAEWGALDRGDGALWRLVP